VGGHDPVYTTDPKTSGEVTHGVDLRQENRMVEAGKLRLGPHLAPLARFADRLSFVNGIQVDTPSHETGLEQFVRLKTNPTAAEIRSLEMENVAPVRAGVQKWPKDGPSAPREEAVARPNAGLLNLAAAPLLEPGSAPAPARLLR
jgi:hypothetical protein